MDLDELALDPTSRRWEERKALPPAPPPEMADPCRHCFWMVDDEGVSRYMVWTDDGRIVPVDDDWGYM